MVGHRLRVRVDGVNTVEVADVQAAYQAFNWALSGLVRSQDSQPKRHNGIPKHPDTPPRPLGEIFSFNSMTMSASNFVTRA